LLLLAATNFSSAAVRYVDLNNSNPVPPYTNWSTSAITIQDAVDAASSGDEIVVTNGVYQTGGRAVVGLLTNRVAVANPVTVRSVNGPEVTVIRGCQARGTTNVDGAVRCVYLAGGASLNGFTLTNGATRQASDSTWEESVGGGVWCESSSVVVSNCTIIGNSGLVGGGILGGTLYNCTLAGNSASIGGGAYESVLNNCWLANNSATNGTISIWNLYGGGAARSTLTNCTLTDNRALFGGGVADCEVFRCVLTGNYAVGVYKLGPPDPNGTPPSPIGGLGGGAFGNAPDSCIVSASTLRGNSGYAGGGAYRAMLSNCIVADNSAAEGGGVYGADLSNCLLRENWAATAGGAFGGSLNNCTVVKNFADDSGGGVVGTALTNCIVYFNAARVNDNHDSSGAIHCCTTPLPLTGVGNFEDRPKFVGLGWGDYRLWYDSPCINAGRNLHAPDGLDIDGFPRISGGAVDVGAYECQNPASTISYVWLKRFGLPLESRVDHADADGDLVTNYQEWRDGTDPTDAASNLRLSLLPLNDADWLLTWPTVPGRTYALELCTDLNAQPQFVPLVESVVGQSGMTSVNIGRSREPGPFLFRLRVEE
jgi:hypothetical protein